MYYHPLDTADIDRKEVLAKTKQYSRMIAWFYAITIAWNVATALFFLFTGEVTIVLLCFMGLVVYLGLSMLVSPNAYRILKRGLNEGKEE